VPDDLIIGLIKEELKAPECSKGFILDGFPRTIPQAEALDEMLDREQKKLNRAFEFLIDDSILVRRITGRLTHKASGRVYHVDFNPPKVAGKDDVTGEPLIRRKDDNEEALKARLVAYHTQTEPIVKLYKSRGILTVLEAERNKAFVSRQIRSALSKHT